MIKEIAIALFDSHGGVEEGDVVVCRDPIGWIGKKEGRLWLWFVADIDPEIVDIIAGPLMSGKIVIKKKRFKVPLEKVKIIKTDFDEIKARDLEQEYQPYSPVNSEYVFEVDEIEPLDLTGSIFDKAIGDYI